MSMSLNNQSTYRSQEQPQQALVSSILSGDDRPTRTSSVYQNLQFQALPTQVDQHKPHPGTAYIETMAIETTAMNQTFPVKLFYALEEIEKAGLQDVVSWLPHGMAFRVNDRRKFVKNILKCYFGQSSYESFIRQLNLYDFHRITDGPDKHGYWHPFFLKNRPYLAYKVTRIRCKGMGPRKPSSAINTPNVYELAKMMHQGYNTNTATMQACPSQLIPIAPPFMSGNIGCGPQIQSQLIPIAPPIMSGNINCGPQIQSLPVSPTASGLKGPDGAKSSDSVASLLSCSLNTKEMVDRVAESYNLKPAGASSSGDDFCTHPENYPFSSLMTLDDIEPLAIFRE